MIINRLLSLIPAGKGLGGRYTMHMGWRVNSFKLQLYLANPLHMEAGA